MLAWVFSAARRVCRAKWSIGGVSVCPSLSLSFSRSGRRRGAQSALLAPGSPLWRHLFVYCMLRAYGPPASSYSSYSRIGRADVSRPGERSFLQRVIRARVVASVRTRSMAPLTFARAHINADADDENENENDNAGSSNSDAGAGESLWRPSSPWMELGGNERGPIMHTYTGDSRESDRRSNQSQVANDRRPSYECATARTAPLLRSCIGSRDVIRLFQPARWLARLSSSGLGRL